MKVKFKMNPKDLNVLEDLGGFMVKLYGGDDHKKFKCERTENLISLIQTIIEAANKAREKEENDTGKRPPKEEGVFLVIAALEVGDKSVATVEPTLKKARAAAWAASTALGPLSPPVEIYQMIEKVGRVD